MVLIEIVELIINENGIFHFLSNLKSMQPEYLDGEREMKRNTDLKNASTGKLDKLSNS